MPFSSKMPRSIVCTHTCTHACMCTLMCVRMHACTHMLARMHAHMHGPHTHARTHACMQACMHTRMHTKHARIKCMRCANVCSYSESRDCWLKLVHRPVQRAHRTCLRCMRMCICKLVRAHVRMYAHMHMHVHVHVRRERRGLQACGPCMCGYLCALALQLKMVDEAWKTAANAMLVAVCTKHIDNSGDTSIHRTVEDD